MDAALLIIKGVSKTITTREVRRFLVSSPFYVDRHRVVRCLISIMKHRVPLSSFELFSRGEGITSQLSKSYFCTYNKTSFTPAEGLENKSSGSLNRYSLRTHTCGELKSGHEGCKVHLFGWVEFIRYNKFIVLRDSYGSTQILISDMSPGICKSMESLNFESVVSVEGTVVLRPPEQVNPKMLTGEIEVVATNISILGPAPQQLPFPIRKFQVPAEQLAMRYRYLYLRYPHMQSTLRLRSSFLHNIREFLIQRHFVDVETPTLFRRTPGGAQEFIVPTQTPGLYYSLVQSPQQFKQLLMVGGIDRYFQIARCYRDEATRPDRQPEFTQLDIELSFVDRESVISLIEDLLLACWPSHLEVLSAPFPRISFQDAFSQYGSDKPDIRFNSKIMNVTSLTECAESPESQKIFDDDCFTCQSVLFRNAATVYTRAEWKEIQKQAQVQWPSSPLFVVPINQKREVAKLLGQYISERSVQNLLSNMNINKGDLLLLGLGPKDCVIKMLGAMRVRVADCLEIKGHLIRLKGYHFAWIFDFPLFEADQDGRLNSAHHPFTQPHPEDLHLLDSDPLKVRGLHYDLVLNGAEVGGGSIRISNSELQRKILFDHLNIETDSLHHLLDALSLGCPPHGGIALGIDRLIASICGTKSIREVIAFPKGSNGQDLMSHAPSPLSETDAKLYGLPFQKALK